MKNLQQLKQLDDRLAPIMFGLSLAFLSLLAAIFHVTQIWVSTEYLRLAVSAIGLMYLVFLVELTTFFVLGADLRPMHFLACLFPFMRFACSDHAGQNRIWLPFWGWRERTRDFSDRLQRFFSGPMIVIALVVLPLMAVEFFWSQQVQASAFWSFVISIVTGMIWFAFTFEFVLLVSSVEKKLQYCIRHWLDLLVILLPVTAVMRAVRLTQLMRLQKVTRTVRLFRVRGLAMRAWRAVLALDLLSVLLLMSPENQLDSLERKLSEQKREVASLESRIQKLRQKIEEKKAEEAAAADRETAL